MKSHYYYVVADFLIILAIVMGFLPVITPGNTSLFAAMFSQGFNMSTGSIFLEILGVILLTISAFGRANGILKNKPFIISGSIGGLCGLGSGLLIILHPYFFSAAMKNLTGWTTESTLGTGTIVSALLLFMSVLPVILGIADALRNPDELKHIKGAVANASTIPGTNAAGFGEYSFFSAPMTFQAMAQATTSVPTPAPAPAPAPARFAPAPAPMAAAPVAAPAPMAAQAPMVAPAFMAAPAPMAAPIATQAPVAAPAPMAAPVAAPAPAATVLADNRRMVGRVASPLEDLTEEEKEWIHRLKSENPYKLYANDVLTFEDIKTIRSDEDDVRLGNLPEETFNRHLLVIARRIIDEQYFHHN